MDCISGIIDCKAMSIIPSNPLRIRRYKWRFSKTDIKKMLPRLIIGFIVFILVLIAWYSKDLPTPNRIKRRTEVASTQILDRNGKLIFAFSGEKKRLPIPFEEIPAHVKNATIAVEDKDFYRHGAVQPKAVLRAFLNNILPNKKSIQGGSTITQQYVKNALLTQKRTLSRKIKEVILAIEMEALYSKDEILGFYLNEIPYGSNAYGIEAASRTYFNKGAIELNLPETAALIALPQAPSYYSPYGTHKDELLVRKNLVLELMAKQGYLTREEADTAKKEEVKFVARRDTIVAPHFVFYVKDYLVDKYGEKMVDEGGLKVTTTLDLDVQKMAEEAVEKGSKNLDRRGANNAALAAVETKTGQILAMVGSRDYFNNDIDGQVNVTTAKRQPGSSFKPVVYATAFKEKYNPAHVLYDVSTDFGGGYRPENYTGQNYGPVTMRQALSNSLNIPAVKTLALVGLNEALKTSRDLGITTLTQPDRYGLSLVLGGGEVRPLEMAGAFAVFGNEGQYNEVAPILKIENERGKILEEFKKPQNKSVLDGQIAYEMSDVLSDNEARKLVFGFTSNFEVPGHRAAAKTGTTQEFRDAWTNGYTRHVSASVWVGNTNNKAMGKGADGSVLALPIWHDFMVAYHKNKEPEDFPVPSGIQQVTVDKLSNKLPTQYSPELITDIFSSWQVPTEKDDIHVVVKINKTTGQLASQYTPSELVENRLYSNIRSEKPNDPNWEEPVRAWAVENGLLNSPPTESDSQYNAPDKKPTISISRPATGEKITTDMVIDAAASATYGVKEVQFFVDGVQVGTDLNAPYSFTYPIANLSSGSHTVKVVAVDQNGATANATVTVTVPGGPPTISGITITGISTNSATVTWTSSKPATSKVDYGVNTNYDFTSGETTALTTSHRVNLSSLLPKTTYHFRVSSKDGEGNSVSSADLTFTTQ